MVQAIDFVQMQGDEDLWDLLISLALGSAEFTGNPAVAAQLLLHQGGMQQSSKLLSVRMDSAALTMLQCLRLSLDGSQFVLCLYIMTGIGQDDQALCAGLQTTLKACHMLVAWMQGS